MFNRRIYSIFSLFLIIVLFGCSTNIKSNDKSSTNSIEKRNAVTLKLDTNDSLVFSTYMASGLLTVSNNTSSNLNLSTKSIDNNKLVKLSDTTTTDNESKLQIETELDEVNKYFDKLKVFMDKGVDSVLIVNNQASTVEGYDYEITYTIEGMTYSIYYSIITKTPVLSDETANITEKATNASDDHEEDDNDEQEFELIGLMVINEVKYELAGANKIEDNEQKMWFETIDTNNGGNSVRVEIKNEDDQQKFKLYTLIDGVESKTEIKFEQEENETKVKLKLIQGEDESSYQFKKEVEDGETTYKFQYQIGKVKGEVKIFELTDSEGNIAYKYDIKENGKHKKIDKEVRGKDDKVDKDHEKDDDESDVTETI